MKKHLHLFSLLAFLLFSFTSCTAQDSGPVFPGEEWAHWPDIEEAGFSKEGMDRVYRFVRDSMNTTGAMVVYQGRVLSEFGDIEELSYLASCRKSILAMLYGKYVKDGTISLETTLDDLDFDDVGGLLPVEKKATIHHLITARSGIYHPASNGGDSSADAPERGSQDPGSYFLYNNWDFNAAGAIFEDLTGSNIYDELEQQLAIPLQMQDWDRTAQRKGGNPNYSRYMAYHMWLSTRDMARIGYLMLHEGHWDGTQVIDKNWARQIVSEVTPLEEMNPQRYRKNHFSYGYMWWLWAGNENKGDFAGAYTAKGAYGQYITVLPAIDMVIAHKTNAKYRRVTGWNEYERMLKLLLEARNRNHDTANNPL